MVSSKEALASAALSDPLTYGISHIDLLQGRKWQVSARAWIKDIYAAVNPYTIEKEPVGHSKHMVIMKGTQVGMTTMALVKMFHFADYWPVRVMYMLPRQQDYIDFATTRIDPMILSSKRLREKIGVPNSTRSKKLGDSYLFFMESTVEPRSMPADAIMVDEVDLSEPTNVATLLNRMDDSNWKLRYYFSTPTLPNYGIHGRYLQSDMRKWLVKCPRCNEWQEMEWEQNLRVVGRQDEPTDIYLGCAHCGYRFDVQTITDNGAWVAEKPERSIIGFHISQLMNHPVKELYGFYLDPETSLLEFYRKRLGKPYEVAGGSITREDFLANCFHQYELFTEEIAYDGSSTYYAGIDQGNEIQMVIAKLPKGSKIPKIVRIELIPFPTEEETTDPDKGWNRVGKLLRLFKIKKAVSDASPNRHSVRNLQANYLGRLIMADYTNIKDRYAARKDKRKKNLITEVNINQVEAFDDLMDSIRKSYWALPGLPPILSSDVELLIAHATSLKRDIEERRTMSGIKKVPVWRKLRADHLAHCLLYCKLAIEIDTGSHHKIAIIGAKPEPGIDEEDTEKKNHPHPNIIAQILPRLAEISQEQAQLYFTLKENKTLTREKLPMPLQHKLNLVEKQGNTLEDIEWVLSHIALHGNEPIKLPKRKINGNTLKSG